MRTETGEFNPIPINGAHGAPYAIRSSKHTNILCALCASAASAFLPGLLVFTREDVLARISHQDFGFRCICSVSECASGLKSIAIAMV